MNRRDYDYIEARLLAPADAAMDAHERLADTGQRVLADRLMAAMQAFADECRAIRRELGARP